LDDGLAGQLVAFGFMLLIIWCASFVANSIALCLGAALPLPIASILAPIVMIMNMLFGGFFANTGNIPSFISWIKYISFVNYAFSAAVQIEFGGLEIVCEDDQYTTASDGTRSCPITRGEQVIEELEADEFTIWECVVILCAMIIVYRFLAYIALRFAKPEAI